jgi:hypothetical protein
LEVQGWRCRQSPVNLSAATYRVKVRKTGKHEPKLSCAFLSGI